MSSTRGRKKTKVTSNQLPVRKIALICIAGLFIYFTLQTIWSLQRVFVQNQTIKKLSFTLEHYKKQEQLLSPTPVVFPSISVTPTPLPSNTMSLPHENLPGFAMDLPAGWNVYMKQFRDRDSHGFDNTYTPSCAENCMGIRLSQGAVFLQMIFDEAYDSNGLKCSNSVDITTIGNDWYRLKTQDGFLYAWKPQVDVTLTSENSPGYYFGKKSDEWSVIKDTKYDICLSGFGYFLSEHSPAYPGVDGKGIPLLLEFPKIIGSPTSDQLKQLDRSVSSINGLWVTN